MAEDVANLKALADQLEEASPEQIVSWALDTYHPNLALASSFGLEDVALIDMMVRVQPQVKVFYLDTELLFAQTYDTMARIRERYHIELKAYRSQNNVAEQAAAYGEALWARDPDLCCYLRKVEPLERALGGLDAWVTGIRREQTAARAAAKVVEWDARFGLVKVNPLVRWSLTEVRQYVVEHEVPYNPMHDEGYPSVGCVPCTRAVAAGEDPRAGRWAGFLKTECGLHPAEP